MQMVEARRGRATEDMKAVAKTEGRLVEFIMKKLAEGRLIIPRNVKREDIKVKGIGEGLRTKVNANVGTAPDYADIDEEVEKAKVAVKYGADSVMDFIGGGIDEVRRQILKTVNVPVGTVPIYQAGIEAAEGGSVVDMGSDDNYLKEKQ